MENLSLQEETDSVAVQDSAESATPLIPAKEAETVDVIHESDIVKMAVKEALARRVINEALGNKVSGFKLLVFTVHAVILESGFVRVDQDSGTAVSFSQQLDDSPSVCSWRYTLPKILTDGASHSVKLEFRTLGHLVNVCGSLSDDDARSSFHCIRLDQRKSSRLLELMMENSEYKASVKDFRFGNEVFEMWKMVKDDLALPLMIDLCEKAELDLPPCWTRLPMDHKLKILERLPGVDLARVACTCSELRYLASTKDLWKKRCEEEFGLVRDTRAGWHFQDLLAELWLIKYIARVN